MSPRRPAPARFADDVGAVLLLVIGVALFGLVWTLIVSALQGSKPDTGTIATFGTILTVVVPIYVGALRNETRRVEEATELPPPPGGERPGESASERFYREHGYYPMQGPADKWRPGR